MLFSQRAGALLFLPQLLLIGGFVFAVSGVVVSSFSDAEGRISLHIYQDLLTSPATRAVIVRTVIISLWVTLISLIIAYPLSFFLAASRHRNLMLIIVISPWLTSLVVRTFGWVVLLGNRGVVNHVLMEAGLIERPIRILYTQIGVIIGLVHVFLPFMILAILSVLLGMDRKLTEGGYSLGAGPFETFRRVTLPLSLPGVITGCSLVYLLASGAIVTPLLLGGLRESMLGTAIYQDVFYFFRYDRAAALAMILVVTSLVVVLPLQLVEAWLRKRTGR